MTAAGRPERAVSVGVDIGGTKVLGVAVDETGAVVAETRVATPAAGVLDPPPGGRVPGGPLADAVAEVVAILTAELRARAAPPALGVGVPGMLDRHGVLRFSPHLPGAEGARLGELLAARLPGVSVTLENDANCAAVAEHRLGAGRGVDELLVITLGTGIGGGLVVGGRVLLGAYGFAGEVGHMLVDPAGAPCPCGRRGCWERYASGGGLGRLAREAAYAGRLHQVVALAGGDPEAVRGEHVTSAARAGDEGALGVMEELGWWLALGLANLTAVVDPARIVVGGGLAAAGPTLLGPTRAAFAELVEGAGRRPVVEIVEAEFGERAGAVGAALAARSGVGER